MQKFLVTFGQQYRMVTHPSLPDAHPDGVVEIEAENIEAARVVAETRLGLEWSNIYPASTLDLRWYPRGVIEKWAQVRQGPGLP